MLHPSPQHAYGKASNTGTFDSFGYSVALSGDTLAVGATEEDGSSRVAGAFQEASAGQSVGGDEHDDSAFGSGAVYALH